MKIRAHFNFNTCHSFSKWRASRNLLLFTLMTATSVTPALAQYATGGVTGGTSGGTTATGAGAIAVGGGTGSTATASNTGAVAIGKQTAAKKTNDIAIGNLATADGLPAGAAPSGSSIAIGDQAASMNANDIALGYRATADGNTTANPATGTAVAAGYFSKAKGFASVAIGNSATVYGAYSIGIGAAKVGTSSAQADHSNQSIAMGEGARAGLPLTSNVNRSNSIAIGTGSSSVFDAIAFGGGSDAYGDHSIAIGIATKTGNRTIIPAVGATPAVPAFEAPSAIAIGSNARALRGSAIAVGVLAVADGIQAIAIGEKAIAPLDESLAVGTSATTTSALSTAIGTKSTTQGGQARDVALGWESATQPYIATPTMTIAGTPYNFAGKAPNSTVSVGKPTINPTTATVSTERTITNVAAGRVIPTSTDAINGSQLDAVIKELEKLKTAFDAYKATHP